MQGQNIFKEYQEGFKYKHQIKILILAGMPTTDTDRGQRSSQMYTALTNRYIEVIYVYYFNKDIINNNKNEMFYVDFKKNLLNTLNDMLVICQTPVEEYLEICKILKNKNCKIVYEVINNWNDKNDLEFEFFKIADLTTYVTKQMDSYVTSSNKLYLPNAANEIIFNRFKKYQVQSKEQIEKPHIRNYLKKLREKYKKIILYYGSLCTDWFSWKDLLNYVNNHQDFMFIIIGKSIREQTEQFKDKTNINFLSRINICDLPIYSHFSDICIIPFKSKQVCEFCSPIKIFEYIFMNKPVVINKELTDVLDYPNINFDLNNITKSQDNKVNQFIIDNNWNKRLDNLFLKLSYKLNFKFVCIILCYNNKNIIELCIDSLIDVKKYINLDIILVDNNSTDGSYDFIKTKYGDKLILLKNNKNGCSSGRNLGMTKIQDQDYIVFLDSDQFICSASSFYEATYVLNNYPNIGAVGWAAGCFGKKLNQDSGNNNLEIKKFGFRTDIDYLGTGGLFLRKDIISKIKFDEYYDPASFEDTDLSFQIKQQGYKLAAKKLAGILHIEHQTTGKLTNYINIFNRNKKYFKNKWNVKWF